MKISDLPKCPDCGLSPEFNFKEHSFGSCFGALKCPFNHHRVTTVYGAGSQRLGREKLMEKWVTKISEKGSE